MVIGVDVTATLNVRAKEWAFRELFLADPDDGHATCSLALAELASRFCEHVECSCRTSPMACRKHAQAMTLGVAKMIVGGEVLAELSYRGVVFVRLSPKGALSPSSWKSVPDWFHTRPALTDWARSDADRRQWEARA